MGDYYDLGSYSCPVTVSNSQAQLWFDRGLVWTYGYNHQEAVSCFRKAVEADSNCAMAFWGIAYATGPNYNMPWHRFDTAARAKALSTCHNATLRALQLLDRVTSPEAALIRALSARYPQADVDEDMHKWNHDFADAMRVAVAAHPDHLDVRAVHAEALLNLNPWKMWDLTAGIPTAGAATVEAQETLESALSTLPGAMVHPGLLHLYVHLMEMSPTPEKALKAGDALRTLCPDAGHLIHMPSHIDVLCGQYHDVVHWNQQAVAADLKFFAREGAFNMYTGYRQHNYHFIMYGAMFLGQIEPALEAVRELAASTPEDMLRVSSPPMADYFESYMAMEPHVLVRFGRFQELVRMSPPSDQELYVTLTANTLYARTVAFAALGRVDEAEKEEKLFLSAKERVPRSRLLHNNTVCDLLEIAAAMARGEIEYRKGNHDAAFAHLRRAVHLEDTLEYDEPWGWMQPTRHALGALLLEQGHVVEAEAAYREDLGLGGQLSRATVHPGNVWALRGLHDCLKARGDTVEIAHIKQQLDIALARADQDVAASCFCAKAAMGVAR